MLERSRASSARRVGVSANIADARPALRGAGKPKMARANYATARSVLEDSVNAHPADPTYGWRSVSLTRGWGGLPKRCARPAGRSSWRPSRARPVATAVMGGAVEVFAESWEDRRGARAAGAAVLHARGENGERRPPPRVARVRSAPKRSAVRGTAGTLRHHPVKVSIVGAGPAGLYLAILLKRADPSHQVTVLERNRPDDTFGFGVVFSDATLENSARPTPRRRPAIAAPLRALGRHRDPLPRRRHALDRPRLLRASSARLLLEILQGRARALGVELHCGRRSATCRTAAARRRPDRRRPTASNSLIRERLAAEFRPHIDWRRNRFVWLGTTCPFPAFTFYFKETPEHGLWRVHAYQYAPGRSTFIVEAREETWRRAGLAEDDEAATHRATCERLFADELAGPPAARRTARSGATSRPCANARWHAGNVVLAGRRRAHRALLDRLGHQAGDGGRDRARRGAPGAERARARARSRRTRPSGGPQVESLQRAAQASLEWFEATERYHDTGAAPVRVQPAHPQPPHHPREPEGPRPGFWSRRWTAGSPSRPAGRAAAPCRSIRLPRRCSRPSGCASSCCPTASWCRRCASTAPRTGCRTTGTWCTWAAARSAAPGW